MKKNKISFFRQQYENFKIKEEEFVEDMISRFQTIMNSLKALGKEYDEEEKVRKIIKSLLANWKAKRVAIEEAKDLSKLKVDELVGSLRLYELELQEDGKSKGGKLIALKAKESEAATSRRSRNKNSEPSASKAFKACDRDEMSDTSDDSSEDEELSIDDEISLISRNLKKLWKNRRGGDKFRKFREKKTNEVTCYECKKPGHIKPECPNLKKKNKKFHRKGKKKGLLSTWDDSDISSSEEENAEAAHLALMANTDSESSEDESEVYTEPSELEKDYKNLLRDSQILVARYFEIK